MNLLVKIINFLGNLIIGFLNSVINILPDSPFGNIKLDFGDSFLAYLNWIFPLTEIVSILGLVITCYIAYLSISFILRFLKVIR